MSWLFNTRPIGLGSHPEAKLSLPQPIYFRFLSSFLSRSYSLSLHHVAGHVGNITGEILSTINSPSPYWLTHQHSSSLAGHSPSALADRWEMKAALALRSSVMVVVVVPGVGLCSLSWVLPQTWLCLSHLGQIQQMVPVRFNERRRKPSRQALLVTWADLGTASWIKARSILNVKETGHRYGTSRLWFLLWGGVYH